jgi:hypothetical protein
MEAMKRVLVLLTLLALVPCSQCLAQAPQPAQAALTAPAPQTAVATVAPPSLKAFLATLPGAEAPGNGTLPTPNFLSTICHTSADCPQGQLCCYPCGIDGCNFVCTTPWRNRCPPIP